MFTLDDSGSMQFEIMPDNLIKQDVRYMFPRASGIYGGSDYNNYVVGFNGSDLTPPMNTRLLYVQATSTKFIIIPP